MVAVVLLLFFLFFPADVVVEVGGKFGKTILGTDTMLVSAEAGVALCCTDTRIQIPVRDTAILRYIISPKMRIRGYGNIF